MARVHHRGRARRQAVFVSGPHAFFWERGTVRDLGTLGGTGAVAADMNERGQVAGFSTVADGSWHAFLWTDGVMQDLGPRNAPGISGFPNILPHSPAPNSINNGGDVIWTVGPSGANRAMLWRNGAAQDMGTLGGPASSSGAINDAGLVAGVSTVPDDPRLHVFLWDNGTMRDLGAPLGAEYGNVESITALNEYGQILLTMFKGGSAPRNSMLLWNGSAWVDIGGAASSLAGDLNNSGQAVGTEISFPGAEAGRPFSTSRGRLSGTGFAYLMNESGTVAGYTGFPFNSAVTSVWSGDSVWKLNTSTGSAEESEPIAINNHGDLVGWHRDHVALWRHVVTVAVDIKPGSDENPIQSSSGLTPVALLSSSTFDATLTDMTTVEFARAPAVKQAVNDVDGDGTPDLTLWFDSGALVLADGATQACLRGETSTAIAFKGCDAVRVKSKAP